MTKNEVQTSAPGGLPTAYADWKKIVEKELQGVPFEKKLITRTADGIDYQPLYTALDAADIPALASQPGEAPYLRGAKASPDGKCSWDFAQEFPCTEASAWNTTVRRSLSRGMNSVVCDFSEWMHEGKTPDASVLFEDIELGYVPLYLNLGPIAGQAVSEVLPAVRARIGGGKLTGAITADPLAEWVREGDLAVPYVECIAELATWTKQAQEFPGLKTIGIDASVWHEAGGSTIQELAYAIATGVEYMKNLDRHDVSLAESASRMRFTFAIGPQFYLEAAKFRAFRLIWGRVLASFGIKPESAWPSIHARTGNWNKSILDPNVNMLRVTTEALSAVLGGIDSLTIAPYNEVAGANDEIAQRIALNIHTLLAEEFSLAAPQDPLGGSWCIEKITDDLARKSWALFQKVAEAGGIVSALHAGTIQQDVAKVAAAKNQLLDQRRHSLIGVNLFANPKDKISAPLNVPHEAVEFPLAAAPHSTKIVALRPRRASEGFEALRLQMDAYAKKNKARAKVFVAKMGPVLQHKARADFAAGFFSVAGFELLAKQSFETAADAAKAAADSGAPIAVLCSTDDTYPTLAPDFARVAKMLNPNIKLVLAGYPTEIIETLKQAGFDDFIHIRANVRETLSNLMKQAGVA